MSQTHTPTTTRVHYKLYKAGKFWLVGTLATVTLVAGLAITQPASANTNDEGSSSESSATADITSTPAHTATLSSSSASSTSDSTTNTPSNDTTETDRNVTQSSSANETNSTDSNPTSEENSSSTDSASSQESTSSVSSTDTNASSVNNDATTTATDNPTSISQKTVSTKKSVSTTNQTAVLATSGLAAEKSVNQLMQARLAPKSLMHTAVSPVAESMTDTATDTAITAPKLPDAPFINNFYIIANGKYVLYNAKASANVYPYVVANYTFNGITTVQPYELGIQLFGFYVILPQHISGDVQEFQTAADTYVADMQKYTLPDAAGVQQHVYDINKITVASLGLTSDGTNRQVYYFRPDDKAKIVTVPSTTPSQLHQPTLHLPISSGTDANGDLPPVQINAPLGTATTMAEYIASAKSYDILFAGANSYGALNPKLSGYASIATSDLITNAPDEYMVGEIPNLGTTAGWARTLTYIHVPVTDTYNVVDATGALIKRFTVTAQDGTTYERTGLTDTISSLAATTATNSGTAAPLTNQNYWGGSISITSSTTNTPGTSTQEMIFTPTTLEVSSDTSSAPGNTYTVTLDPIKTALIPQVLTITAGEKWDPADTLTGTSPDGSALAVDDAINGNTAKTLGSLSYTITDTSNNAVVDEKALQNAGTYAINYSYSDIQGNTTTATATIQVKANLEAMTVTSPADSLVPGTTWDPSSAITGSLTDAQGQSVDVATALADGSLTITDSNGNPVTSPVAYDKVGLYPFTYTYTSGGKTLTDTATVQVISQAAMIVQPTPSLTADATWTPSSAISTLKDAQGEDVDVATALADGTLTITDSEGNPAPTSYDTVGLYPLTYTYTDKSGGPTLTKTAVVDVTTQATMTVAQPTTPLAPGFTPSTLVTTLTDAQGNNVDVAKALTDGTLTITDSDGNPASMSYDRVGSYPLIYTYTANGKTLTDTVTVQIASEAAMTVQPTPSLTADTTWTPSSAISELKDAQGQDVDITQALADGSLTILDSNGNPAPTSYDTVGSYTLTYTYKDKSGGPDLTEKVTVNVDSQATMALTQSTVSLTPGTAWNPSSVVTGLTDAQGNSVDVVKALADGSLTITDSNGQSAPTSYNTVGSYPLTYTYTANGKQTTSIVTVDVTSNAVMAVQPTTSLTAGTTWNPSSAITTLKDADGNDIDVATALADGTLTITDSNNNLMTAATRYDTVGSYPITYTYKDKSGGPTLIKNMTVQVTANQAALAVTQPVDPLVPGTAWNPSSVVSELKDAQGNDIDVAKALADGTLTIEDGDGNPVASSVSYSKAGTYPLIYTYTAAGKTLTKAVTVQVISKADMSVTQPATPLVPGTTWNPSSVISELKDAQGNDVDVAKALADGSLTITDGNGNAIASTVSYDKAGSYPLTYTYTADGTPVTKTVTVQVATPQVTDQTDMTVTQPTMPLTPGTTWKPSSIVSELKDAQGNDVDVAKALADGTLTIADSNGNLVSSSITYDQAGSYPLTYTYTADGQTVTKTVTVQVATPQVTDQTDMTVIQPTTPLTPGATWNPSSIVSELKDAQGNDVDVAKALADGSLTITDGNGNAITSTVSYDKAGSYPLTYTYTADGQTVTKTVTVQVATPQVTDQIDMTVTQPTTPLTPGATWNPSSIVSELKDAQGNDVDVAKALADGTLTIADSNGNLVSSSIAYDKDGSYPLTYTYTVDGKTLTRTVTIQVTTPQVTDQTDMTITQPTAPVTPGTIWNPSSVISGLKDAQGNSVDVTTALADGSLTITDADGNLVTSSVSYNKVGTYPLTYTYTASGKTLTNTVTVQVAGQASMTVIQPTATVTAGTTWNPVGNLTSITTANGTTIAPATALADKSLTVTVTDTAGNLVTVDSSTKLGTYTVTYTYQDPAGGDPITQTAILTIAAAPTTGGSGTNTGSETNTGTTTPDNGGTPTIPTKPVTPAQPAKTTKPVSMVRPPKKAATNNPVISTHGVHASKTPSVQTGVTPTASTFLGGEAANVSNRQNNRNNLTNGPAQAQSNQSITGHNANQLKDSTTSATTLPQTNEQSTSWTAQLGVLLLSLAGALGFRRKRN